LTTEAPSVERSEPLTPMRVTEFFARHEPARL
jgi:hypothetical protein